ncbi:DEAD/DEAH box helicase [bacterium]|nr:DEAD/DEAH box helicase [bacterium]
MFEEGSTLPGFETFGLSMPLLHAITDLGYETPTSIQAQTIPQILAGQDVLGQAQTGTGKTAAFALPFLNYLNIDQQSPQILVLTPTRELAIQVSEAFQDFAKYMHNVSVLPVYGGADIRGQLRALKKGVHIVVGTPGRVMDHIRRDSLNLKTITTIVLDEADEMLQMGFQEDVEWILSRAPEKRQMALFSATIPKAIRQIARKFMTVPLEITVKTKTTTAPTIQQQYWMISGMHKLDALSRILEAQEYDGVLVFVRTRAGAMELAERLEDRGFNTAPLNGDIPQHLREQTVERLKAGRINIIVATDVAARGLDVERISHVINYDMPHDAEAYTHRIGRTGRAGRAGKAILFVSSRERHMLKQIENSTHQKIERMEIPSAANINDQRINNFKQKIADRVKSGDLNLYRSIVKDLAENLNLDPLDIAAAAAFLAQGDTPLLLSEKPVRTKDFARDNRSSGKMKGKRKTGRAADTDFRRVQYRVEVGNADGVKAGNLLGAIANEAGLEGKYIGKISIDEHFSTVDLPEGMPEDVLQELKRVRVAGKQLQITLSTTPVRRSNGKNGKKNGFKGSRKKSPKGRLVRA